MRFKKGDVVICVDDTDMVHIKKNKKYIVNNPDGGQEDLSVTDYHWNYYKWSRFRKLNRELKLKRILK